MSSSAPGAPAGSAADKQPGFSRFMRRASKVLRSSSNRTSVAGAPELTAAPSTTVPAPDPALSKAPASPRPQQVKKAPLQPAELAVPSIPTTAAAYNKQQEEKARALFAKYGMTLEPGEWTPVWKGDAGRVEKHVRLRVHRQCHRCQTTFGPEKICNNCSHTRCKKCPRFPTKSAKDPEGNAAAAGVTPLAAIGAPVPNTRTRTKSLTLPEQPVGNELIRRTPVHRRRNVQVASICDVPNALESLPNYANSPTATPETLSRLILSLNAHFDPSEPESGTNATSVGRCTLRTRKSVLAASMSDANSVGGNHPRK
ncbi:hypothetical protein MMC26_007658 [Xylographa opegraphella]|nr:hypothetical protein [Xylographa opegraphella]